MHRKVDPAALLIAILAVGISPLTTSGEWDILNTIIAGVVGVVLLAFTWPRKKTLQDEPGRMLDSDYWIVIAQAIAYGLIIAIGTAWPIQQYILHAPECPDHAANSLPPECKTGDYLSKLATYRALWIGLGSAIILGGLMVIRIKKLNRQPPVPPTPPSQSQGSALGLLWVMIIFVFSRRAAPISRSSSEPGTQRNPIADRKQ